MLNPGAYHRLFGVGFFTPLIKLVPSIALSMYTIPESIFLKIAAYFIAAVCTIPINILIAVVIVQKLLCHLTVMNRRRRNLIFSYQLVPDIHVNAAFT